MDGQLFAMDYGVLFARLDRMTLSPDDWQQRYDDVRLLEAAAIEQMGKA